MPLGGGLQRIQWTLAGLVLGMLALWLATAPYADATLNLFALRAPSLQGTGLLALALMSVAVLLANRPVRFEPWLGGLDKMYRLHKWLGIGALALAIGHWLWVEVPKWLVELGWLVRPPRGVRGAAAEDLAPLQALRLQLREPAEGAGEWAFYALVLLLALSLWPRIPYRRFFQTHRLLPLVYLLLVFHGVVLLEPRTWGQPLGLLLAVLMAAGSLAALRALLGRVGRHRQVLAAIESVNHTATEPQWATVLEVAVRLQGRWGGHEAGQFAFVRFDAAEGAHPFTITSPWKGDGQLTFLIKGLGDYTRRLPGLLRVGALLRVEGPYGQFNFNGKQPRQVWVGGGIGITPFIARLQQLALQPQGKRIDLFYTSAMSNPQTTSRLQAAARAAHVKLHLMVDAEDGLLDAERLCIAVPDWRHADFWLCGPAPFGKALRKDLLAKGLATSDFHQELFELR